MATKSILPLHTKNPNLRGSVATKTILRLTEKYVLAIALVAFCLVFLGAFYLPQDQLKRKVRGVGSDLIPKVEPHGHGPGDHKERDKEVILGKVKNDQDLQGMIVDMEQQLKNNHQKIDGLEERLKAMKKKSSSQVEDGPGIENPGRLSR